MFAQEQYVSYIDPHETDLTHAVRPNRTHLRRPALQRGFREPSLDGTGPGAAPWTPAGGDIPRAQARRPRRPGTAAVRALRPARGRGGGRRWVPGAAPMSGKTAVE